MKKVIVFGASGNVGHNVVKELVEHNYEVTAVVRTQEKAQQLAELTMNYVIADVQ
ncbi:MAG TPA: NAD(P)H-binding protein, partial [Candidatus Kapabacteria bacterium]|nr:NAD(P)H-binding protein [Candidatus Kapabacteria bacterium]